MHEMSLVEAMLEQADAALDDAGATGQVTGITISVGNLSGASPEAMIFAFDALSKGTRYENGELTILKPKAVLKCYNCNLETDTDQVHFICPECGSDNVFIDGGRELRIDSIVFDDDDDDS